MQKYIPKRMCIVCRQRLTKADLARLERLDGKIIVSNEKNAKGIYVCKHNECIDKIIKKKLFNKIFKCNIMDDEYEILKVLKEGN